MDDADASDHAQAETDAIERHVTSCTTCADFEQIALRTRRALRFDDADVGAEHDPGSIDLTERVLAAIAETRPTDPIRRSRVPRVAVAALFCIGIIAGFVATRWDAGVRPAVARDRASLVSEGQKRVDALRANVEIVERRADDAVPRGASGTLSYVAPEAVLLRLSDGATTTEVGVNGETAWQLGDLATMVTGREPFDRAGWSALELIVPVDAFGRDAGTVVEAEVDGRPASLVTTTVAQVDELLAAVRTGSPWRPLHPSDHVALWLDRSTGVPLRIQVTASADADRVAWSARHALDEPTQGPVFVVELHDVEINPADVAAPTPPGGTRRNLGFSDRDVSDGELPAPTWLPEGMTAHRSGERRSPEADRLVVVRTWTDGRSWVKVTGTRQWTSDRLFGDLGPLVRPIDTDVGVLYAAEDGSAIALHGDGLDLVVTGSVPEADLVHIATSMGVTARDVPSWWTQARSRTAEELATSGVAVLAPAANASGATVAFALDDERVEVAVTGPGARGLRIVQRPGDLLAPAEDPDARTVTVRGVVGRFSPALGELTWVEREHVVVVSTRTLTLAELLAAAEDFEWSG